MGCIACTSEQNTIAKNTEQLAIFQEKLRHDFFLAVHDNMLPIYLPARMLACIKAYHTTTPLVKACPLRSDRRSLKELISPTSPNRMAKLDCTKHGRSHEI
jgi:hypothetical protein